MPDRIANLDRVLCAETHIGKRVRVREDTHRYPPLSVSVGTIEKRRGNPSYVALDVLLDDGSRQLFWFHELEEIAERLSPTTEAHRRVGAALSQGGQ